MDQVNTRAPLGMLCRPPPDPPLATSNRPSRGPTRYAISTDPFTTLAPVTSSPACRPRNGTSTPAFANTQARTSPASPDRIPRCPTYNHPPSNTIVAHAPKRAAFTLL